MPISAGQPDAGGPLVLVVRGMVAGYHAGSRVLDGLSLEVGKGEIVALIGRNGMGKTTFLRALTGHLSCAQGEVQYDGRAITHCKPYEIARRGIAYVPQGREIFPEFTVEQNLIMGLLGHRGLSRPVPDWAYQVFPVLRERKTQRAGTLSGGQQQQLAIMRALIGDPRFLLLDEPSEGIQPSIVMEIGATLHHIAGKSGLTILLVEQNLDLVASLASRCLFMENGRIADEVDDVTRLTSDQGLVHRYLSV